jgi:hypothetical protein
MNSLLLMIVLKARPFLGQKNFFICPYAMASRTRTCARMRCRQQLLQTSSQKLLHLQTLFFAHM